MSVSHTIHDTLLPIFFNLIENLATKYLEMYTKVGAHSGAVVEALRYNPEGHLIDSRWCHWNFSLS
jgi:hypothetical protein